MEEITYGEYLKMHENHIANGGRAIPAKVSGYAEATILFNDNDKSGTVIRFKVGNRMDPLKCYMTQHKNLPKTFAAQVEKYYELLQLKQDALDMAVNVENMAQCIANPDIKAKFLSKVKSLRDKADAVTNDMDFTINPAEFQQELYFIRDDLKALLK